MIDKNKLKKEILTIEDIHEEIYHKVDEKVLRLVNKK